MTASYLPVRKEGFSLKANYFSFLFLLLVGCSPTSDSEMDVEWPMYGLDNSASKYSSLSQINRSNVNLLKVAWVYHSEDHSNTKKTDIQCNPIIINKRMYLITPFLNVFALEANSGKEIWKFDPFNGLKRSGTNRGLAYHSDEEGERIFYVANSDLYCLDATTGKPILSFGNEGQVDLTKGLGRDIGGLYVTATSPGVVYKDLYILGSRVLEGPAPAAPGHIRAYDLKSGTMKWIFHTIPQPREYGYDTWPSEAYKSSGGANSWGGFTLDEEKGIVFCGTGSPSYDVWGGDREGDNLFANCILALNAENGERIWHYQAVHHDVWDYDIPCPPNLVQVKKGGKLMSPLRKVRIIRKWKISDDIFVFLFSNLGDASVSGS
ncbi:MAG: quinoprotein glucose dehydrogenase [Saprospiraceae bacterium]